MGFSSLSKEMGFVYGKLIGLNVRCPKVVCEQKLGDKNRSFQRELNPGDWSGVSFFSRRTFHYVCGHFFTLADTFLHLSFFYCGCAFLINRVEFLYA